MLSDKQIRILAKQVCKGNRHAMRYQPMLSACFNMAKLVIEEVEKVNIANVLRLCVRWGFPNTKADKKYKF